MRSRRISTNCHNSKIGTPIAMSLARRTRETAERHFRRHTEDRTEPGVAGLLHPGVYRHKEGDSGRRAQQRLDCQRIVEVDRHSQRAVSDPSRDAGADPADQMHEETQRQLARVAVDQP